MTKHRKAQKKVTNATHDQDIISADGKKEVETVVRNVELKSLRMEGA